MPSEHKFLRFILPDSFFEAIKKETKQWLLECPCGHELDLWDVGGVRFKAGGHSRRLVTCPVCGKTNFLQLKKRE